MFSLFLSPSVIDLSHKTKRRQESELAVAVIDPPNSASLGLYNIENGKPKHTHKPTFAAVLWQPRTCSLLPSLQTQKLTTPQKDKTVSAKAEQDAGSNVSESPTACNFLFSSYLCNHI